MEDSDFFQKKILNNSATQLKFLFGCGPVADLGAASLRALDFLKISPPLLRKTEILSGCGLKLNSYNNMKQRLINQISDDGGTSK